MKKEMHKNQEKRRLVYLRMVGLMLGFVLLVSALKSDEALSMESDGSSMSVADLERALVQMDSIVDKALISQGIIRKSLDRALQRLDSSKLKVKTQLEENCHQDDISEAGDTDEEIVQRSAAASGIRVYPDWERQNDHEEERRLIEERESLKLQLSDLEAKRDMALFTVHKSEVSMHRQLKAFNDQWMFYHELLSSRDREQFSKIQTNYAERLSLHQSRLKNQSKLGEDNDDWLRGCVVGTKARIDSSRQQMQCLLSALDQSGLALRRLNDGLERLRALDCTDDGRGLLNDTIRRLESVATGVEQKAQAGISGDSATR